MGVPGRRESQVPALACRRPGRGRCPDTAPVSLRGVAGGHRPRAEEEGDSRERALGVCRASPGGWLRTDVLVCGRKEQPRSSRPNHVWGSHSGRISLGCQQSEQRDHARSTAATFVFKRSCISAKGRATYRTGENVCKPHSYLIRD